MESGEPLVLPVSAIALARQRSDRAASVRCFFPIPRPWPKVQANGWAETSFPYAFAAAHHAPRGGFAACPGGGRPLSALPCLAPGGQGQGTAWRYLAYAESLTWPETAPVFLLLAKRAPAIPAGRAKATPAASGLLARANTPGALLDALRCFAPSQ